MAKNISDLRDLLFATIEGVKDGTIDTDKAKVIGDLSQVMVNTAKAEVDFVKATGGQGSGFIEGGKALPNGITGVHQHRLKG